MVATVEVREINGTKASMTCSGLTSARYCTTDSAIPGTGNSIPIPTSGYNFSFWKHHGLYMHGAFTQIDNIRWFTDGTIGWNLGTSGGLYVGMCSGTDKGIWTSNAIAGSVTEYVHASGTVGTTGIPLYSGHAKVIENTLASAWNLASVYTTAASLIVDTTTHTASGDISKLLLTQVAVDTDATQGTQDPETVTFRYDEI